RRLQVRDCRTVAAADGDRSLSTTLTRYYAEAGNPRGATMAASCLLLLSVSLVLTGEVSVAWWCGQASGERVEHGGEDSFVVGLLGAELLGGDPAPHGE